VGYTPAQKQRLAKGLCKQCSKPRTGKSKVLCERCLTIQRYRSRRYYAKLRGEYDGLPDL
jgi:hypothetical protein